MEIRTFALGLLRATTLRDKLREPAPDLTDEAPGAPLDLVRPARPPGLAIRPLRRAEAPKPGALGDPAQRGRVLHAFANHELQAAELFAWALLAFPRQPAEWRRGALAILRDEQRHARLYVERMEAFGVRFGDLPVSGYFWNKRGHLRSPLRFVCAMCLTFEAANLDHTLEAAAIARCAGDEETAGVLERVHRDEQRHVAFGLRWLDAARAPGETRLAAYERSVRWPLRLALARGPRVHRAPRAAIGYDPPFLAALERAR